MATIRIHTLHAGKVCVAPDLPFGGEGTSLLRTAGVFTRAQDRLWLPVSAYLIEHERGLVLVDTGWARSMSPKGVLDKRAQIESLGSRLLYHTNQGIVRRGQTVAEQLAARGIAPENLDFILLTHLDCDHVNGLADVAGAKHILVANDELASVRKNAMARIRYQPQWWEGMRIEGFDWNGTEGPHKKSYDLFGDGSVVCIAIPGHADGLFAVKVTGEDGSFVVIASDGAYGRRSWEEMVLPGIANNREAQRISLGWIASQAADPLCVEVLANHDVEVKPHETVLHAVREIARPSEDVQAARGGSEVDELKQAAGKAAVAMALASTLAGATISPDQVHLPEPVPIVQTVDLGAGSGAADLPDSTADDQKAGKLQVWEKIVNILKYALVILLIAAAIIFGVARGCAGCVGPAALPPAGGNSTEQPAEQGVLEAAGKVVSHLPTGGHV